MIKSEQILLLSCLKKSIRKGFEDLAYDYANQLYELDKKYLIDKLCHILLEEIGIGNLELLNDFTLNINLNSNKIEILKYVRMMSLSNKDRSIYDLIELNKNVNKKYLEDKLNNKKQMLNEFNHLKQMYNEEIIKNIILKSNIINENDMEIYNIITNGFKINKDFNFILINYIHNIFENEKMIIEKDSKHLIGSIIEKEYEKEIIMNKWLIDGVDWYTQEGKIAIKNFIKRDTETKKYLLSITDAENLNDVIGMLLYKLIGQTTNKRLYYPTASYLYKLNNYIAIKKIINKHYDYYKLINLFKKDYELLKKDVHKVFEIPDPTFFPF